MPACEDPRFDYLIFIGRFQPFHLGHYAVIAQALQRADNIIILLGSAQPEEGLSASDFQPRPVRSSSYTRNLKNLFSATEREHMIRAAFPPDQQRQLWFAALIDVYDDVKWTAMVKQAVAQILQHNQADNTVKIGLIGHFKDQSSYYLALFPEWPLIELENFYQLSATPLRDKYLQGRLPSVDEVPASTLQFLASFQHTPIYQQLQQQALGDNKPII